MNEQAAECHTCLEPIRPGARKCIKCDSYQDWRRFLTASTSALALVIALVSVTSALGPGIVRMLKGDRSALSISYIAPSDDGILLLATNEGTRPAVVHRVSFVSRPDFIDFEIKPKEHLLVNPGKVESITAALKVLSNPDQAYADFMRGKVHSIYVHATQFGGQRETVEISIPRDDLFPLILDGRNFFLFEDSLLSDYTRSNPQLVDGLDPNAIDRIRPEVLDQLSPELIDRLKRAHEANQPKSLKQR